MAEYNRALAKPLLPIPEGTPADEKARLVAEQQKITDARTRVYDKPETASDEDRGLVLKEQYASLAARDRAIAEANLAATSTGAGTTLAGAVTAGAAAVSKLQGTLQAPITAAQAELAKPTSPERAETDAKLAVKSRELGADTATGATNLVNGGIKLAGDVKDTVVGAATDPGATADKAKEKASDLWEWLKKTMSEMNAGKWLGALAGGVGAFFVSGVFAPAGMLQPLFLVPLLVGGLLFGINKLSDPINELIGTNQDASPVKGGGSFTVAQQRGPAPDKPFDPKTATIAESLAHWQRGNDEMTKLYQGGRNAQLNNGVFYTPTRDGGVTPPTVYTVTSSQKIGVGVRIP